MEIIFLCTSWIVSSQIVKDRLNILWEINIISNILPGDFWPFKTAKYRV